MVEDTQFPGVHRDPAPGEDVLERYGIRTAYRQNQAEGYSCFGFGGWGKFVAFDMGTVNVFLDDRDPYRYTEATLIGLGNRADPSPDDGAIRAGVTLGAEHGDPPAQHFVQSDATVTVDPEESDVDAAFTGIVRIDGLSNCPYIAWRDVPMRRGRFASPSIDGWFFGKKHQEVGGAFDREQVVGTFGGNRR